MCTNRTTNKLVQYWTVSQSVCAETEKMGVEVTKLISCRTKVRPLKSSFQRQSSLSLRWMGESFSQSAPKPSPLLIPFFELLIALSKTSTRNSTVSHYHRLSMRIESGSLFGLNFTQRHYFHKPHFHFVPLPFKGSSFRTLCSFLLD